jgi:hypothetical protein
MKNDEDLKEARAQEGRARQAILKLAAEVREALAEDFLEFPSWEVRRRFVSDPAYAAAMKDEDIARLKEAVKARALAARDRVLADLEQPEPWLAGAQMEGNPGKSLAENPALWACTAPVAEAVRAVLVEFAFPGADAPVEYRMPMRFIRKKYMPGLAEKYWALVADLREARARIRECEEGLVKEALGKRWDKL